MRTAPSPVPVGKHFALDIALCAPAGQALPAALPADLLGRRADLVAQRWRVDAATKQVDAARAQFYPDVNLVAFVGLSSIGLDRFLQAMKARPRTRFLRSDALAARVP